MRRGLRYTFAILFLLCCAEPGIARISKITSIADSGTGTLRDEIGAAQPYDTLLICVSGTLNLLNPINITKPLKIIGPTAAHFTINGQNVGINGDGFVIQNVTGTDTVFIHAIGFTGFDGFNAAVNIDNSSVVLSDLLFEANIGASNGRCINASANARVAVQACSFFGNSAASNWGGVSFNSTGSLIRYMNCTFYQNTAGTGGALYTTADLEVFHCTFIDNTSGSAAHIDDGGGGSVTIANNIFSSSAGTTMLLGSSWSDLGGNVFTAASGTFAGIFSTIATDQYVGDGNQAALGLHNTIVIDGYGLKWFSIIVPASPAVDWAVPLSLIPQTDGRRAPRVLQGNSSLKADAGAVEYTPFRVTTAAGAGSFNTIWASAAGSAFPGPRYIEFDLGSVPVTYSIGAVLNWLASTSPLIIDGYTQTGTKVCGPGTTPNTVIPATLQISLNSTSGGFFNFPNCLPGTWLAGLNMDNSAGEAIKVSGGTAPYIYGNHFRSASGNASHAVYVQNASQARVGGDRYHECNVIRNFQLATAGSGVRFDNVNVGRIAGNFIGTSDDGLNIAPNKVGIELIASNGILVGGRRDLPGRNLLSGNLDAQIRQDGGGSRIVGNWIGTDVTGQASLGTNAADGILLVNGASPNIGSSLKDFGNVIVNQNNGIKIDNSSGSGTNIIANFIGITDKAPYTGVNGNVTGINLGGSTVLGTNIGTGFASGRNYISNNSSIGIYIDNAGPSNIRGNFIGVEPDNSASGNGLIGIHLVNSAYSSDISKNLISGHNAAGSGVGIHVNGAGGSIQINDNLIGVDSSGSTARANDIGVWMQSYGTNNKIETNLISGNAGDGVKVEGGVNTLIVASNIIGLNQAETAPIANSGDGVHVISCNGAFIQFNSIGSNGLNGIHFENSGDCNVQNNTIGINSSMTQPFGNGQNGVLCDSSLAIDIGGATFENAIANNGNAGIHVKGNSSQVSMLDNMIFSNGDLGISLDNINPTVPLPNDAGDSDVSGSSASSRGNNGQNYPILTGVSSCAGGTRVDGHLDTSPGTYLIQFFSIPPGSADPSGNGEGNIYLGSSTITAVVGNETFNFTYATTLPVGTVISATCSRFVGTTWETSEFSDTLGINANPVANAGADNTICSGFSTLLDGSGSIGSGLTYTWYMGVTPISTSDTVTVSPAANTQYILQVGNGVCVSTDTVLITVTVPLAATVSYPSTMICTNGGTQSPTVANGGGTFSSSAGLTLNTTSGIIDPSTSSPGTYFVVYTLSGACITQDSVQVQIVPAPTGTVTGGGVFCVGDSTANVIFTNTSGGTWQIDWLVNGSPAGTSFPPGPVYNLSNLGAGTYTANMTLTATGCSAAMTGSVVISFTTPPDASFTTSSASPYCATAGNVTLTPAITGGVFSGTGVSGTVFSPASAGVGTYYIYYTVSNGNCTNVDSLSVTVIPAPPSPTVLSSPPFEFCVGSTQTLNVSSTGGLIGWYSNAALTNQIHLGASLPTNILQSGNYSLWVAELAGGCLSVPLQINSVTVWGNSFISDGGPYMGCPGEEVPVSVNAPIGSTIQWSDATMVSDSVSFAPTVIAGNDVYPFTVSMGVSVSCPVQDSLLVTTLNCDLNDVANAFSPDGDQVNDTWFVAAANLHPENRVTVFNRWGNQLVRIDNYDNIERVWNGEYNGNKVPAGTYYYIIELLDVNETTSGWVHVTY